MNGHLVEPCHTLTGHLQDKVSLEGGQGVLPDSYKSYILLPLSFRNKPCMDNFAYHYFSELRIRFLIVFNSIYP